MARQTQMETAKGWLRQKEIAMVKLMEKLMEIR